jgi:TonB family protein
LSKDDDDMPAEEEFGLVPIFTLVLWVTLLIVSVIGFLTDDSRGSAIAQPAAPPVVELLSVDLSNEAQPTIDSGPREKTQFTPIAAQSSTPLPAAPIALARPGAFPEYRALTPMQTLVPGASAPPERLTFGRGEGRQPAPEYPREAALAGEEGTVVVRFEVDQGGHVEDAQPIVPCSWPLLNQSALRTIRHDWRFSPGPPRAYEISIEFQLSQR